MQQPRHRHAARGSAGHDRIAAGARSRRARADRSGRRDPRRAADLRRRDHRVPQRAGRRWSACRRKRTGSISTALDATYERLRREGRRVKFLYVVPNFQNPTGLLIGLDEAAAAARVGRAARRADRRGRSVSRAVFRGLGHAKPTCGRSRRTMRSGRVIYLSSFSKTLAPGYRVAWIAAPPALAAQFEMAKQAEDLLTGSLDQRIDLRGLPPRRARAPAADPARSTTRTSATSWRRRCAASSGRA